MEANLLKEYIVSAIQFDRAELTSFCMYYSANGSRFKGYKDELSGSLTVSLYAVGDTLSALIRSALIYAGVIFASVVNMGRDYFEMVIPCF